MKLAKKVISLGAACSFLLQASIVYAATIGPRIEQPFNRRLFRAIAVNDITTVQQMLAQGQIALHGNLELGRTPLHWAAIKGHADIILLLLRAGTHIDVKPDNGDTALHQVALRGHTNTIQLLLDEGANPNAENHRGMTPLSKAVSNGHADAARELVKAGAELTPKVEQILIDQGETEFLAELRKLAAQRLEALLAFLERRLPDDIANFLLQIALPSAPSVQQLRTIRAQRRQGIQQP